MISGIYKITATQPGRPAKERMMTVDEWVSFIETQINSPHANYTLAEKLAFLHQYYDNDPSVPKEALDIVRANLVKRKPAKERMNEH